MARTIKLKPNQELKKLRKKVEINIVEAVYTDAYATRTGKKKIKTRVATLEGIDQDIAAWLQQKSKLTTLIAAARADRVLMAAEADKATLEE